MDENKCGHPVEQPLTHALEALLGGLGPEPDASNKLLNSGSLESSGTVVNESLLSKSNSQVAQVHNANSNLSTLSSGSSNRSLESNILGESVENLTGCDKPVICLDQIMDEIENKDTREDSIHCQKGVEDILSSVIDSEKISCSDGKKGVANTSLIETQVENTVIPGLFLCSDNYSGAVPENQANFSVEMANLNGTKSISLINSNDNQKSKEENTVMEKLESTEDPIKIVSEKESMEWEIDSSPIEGSSENETSSNDSEGGEDSCELLSPEEQARILILEDGISDDESGDKLKGPRGQLRTKNEVPEVVIPKPDVVITQDMQIIELGVVEQIVNDILLIKAKISGEYKVLESGSVLCLSDRSVFGVVAETIGPVEQPFYSVLFTNASEIVAAGLCIGTIVFFCEKYCTFVFTRSLKAFKGSDASNINDEEVGEDEIEFSDDEVEAEYKRKIKMKKQERRGGKKTSINSNSKRGRQTPQRSQKQTENSSMINYDDNEDDEPYKPLARPASFAKNIGRSEASLEETYVAGKFNQSSSDSKRNRGRGNRRRFNRNPDCNLIGPNYHSTGTPIHRDTSHQVGNTLQPPYTRNSFTSFASHENLVFPMSSNFFTPAQYPLDMAQFQNYSNHQNHAQQWSTALPPVNLFPQLNPYQSSQNMFSNWSDAPQTMSNGVFINPAFFNQQQRPQLKNEEDNQEEQ